MNNPIINLKFDEELDHELAWDFYSKPEFGGNNFWQNGALKHHPKLATIEENQDPKRFLGEYITEYYRLHSIDIKKQSEKTTTYIKETQGDFFKIVDNIFTGHPWPKSEFVGLFSIFDFCPRFLDEGSFQVFIYDDRRMQLFTIYHEMLHFIFYDFALKTFPNVFKDLNTEEGKFWDMAETFNAVIQDTNDFITLHGKIFEMGYPDHKELISRGKILWKNNPNIKNWITEMEQ